MAGDHPVFVVDSIHKKGRKTLGYWVKWRSSTLLGYVAVKGQEEMYRDSKGTTSNALRNEEAYWTLPLETLNEVEAAGVQFVGVLDKRSNDLYLTALCRFFDPQYSDSHVGRGGALERRVKVSDFKLRRSSNTFQK